MRESKSEKRKVCVNAKLENATDSLTAVLGDAMTRGNYKTYVFLYSLSSFICEEIVGSYFNLSFLWLINISGEV